MNQPRPQRRTCCVCPHLVYNNRVLCKGCERDLRRRLIDQASLHEDLETELTRQARKQPPAEVGKSANKPLPVDLAAGALIRKQHHLLATWVCDIGDSIEDVAWPVDKVPALSTWLHDHLNLRVKSEDIGRMATEFRALNEEIVRLIDVPDKRAIHVGPCPNRPEDSDWCPGEVRAVVYTDEGKPPLAHCTACKTEWPAHQWVEMERRISARLSAERTAKELAEAIIGKSA